MANYKKLLVGSIVWGIGLTTAGSTELYYAARQGDIAWVECCLAEHPEQVNPRDPYTVTPLQTAASKGHKEVVELLLAKGADVNGKTGFVFGGCTALHRATCEGHKEVVEVLLAGGADVNAKTKRGWTPLHTAASESLQDVYVIIVDEVAYVTKPLRRSSGTSPHGARSQREVVELLLAKEAEVNARANDGETPLHLAAEGGDKEVVQLLISKGAKVNTRNDRGETSLHLAVIYGNHEVADLLCKGGGVLGNDMNDAVLQGNLKKVRTILAQKPELLSRQHNYGSDPLHLAALMGRKEIVELLLAKGANVNAKRQYGARSLLHATAEIKNIEPLTPIGKQVDVNTINYSDWPAVHSAAHCGHKDVVELLLASGVAVDTKDKYGDTALHYATEVGAKEVVDLLLAKGAEVNTRDKKYYTPLHVGALLDQKEVVGLLLAKGAHVNAKDKSRLTPLHMAAFEGHKEIVEILLSKGADVNAKDKSRRTPLHMTAFNGHKEVVKLLLAKGDEVNTRGNDDETPLHEAASRGHKEIVELLLSKGADVNAKTEDGSTPMHKAVEYMGIVEFLLAKGADVNARDKHRQTALHLAARKGLGEVARILLSKGARVHARDKDWKTPTDVAHKDVANLLARYGGRKSRGKKVKHRRDVR